MTLPDERYRSIVAAERLMLDLLDSRKTPRVPREIRDRARGVLRHFPEEYYLSMLAEARPDIIAAKPLDELHRMVLQYHIETSAAKSDDQNSSKEQDN